MGAPKGAPVSPPSTISSIALMHDESSEATKSTAFASSSGSPQRPRGTVEENKSATLADCSLRQPRVDGVDSAARALYDIISHWIAVRGHNDCRW
jgi:hypothetical protein